jgi:hypothetical protein
VGYWTAESKHFGIPWATGPFETTGAGAAATATAAAFFLAAKASVETVARDAMPTTADAARTKMVRRDMIICLSQLNSCSNLGIVTLGAGSPRHVDDRSKGETGQRKPEPLFAASVLCAPKYLSFGVSKARDWSARASQLASPFAATLRAISGRHLRRFTKTRSQAAADRSSGHGSSDDGATCRSARHAASCRNGCGCLNLADFVAKVG